LAHELRQSESKACPERRSRQRSKSNGDLRLLLLLSLTRSKSNGDLPLLPAETRSPFFEETRTSGSTSRGNLRQADLRDPPQLGQLLTRTAP
jgi:hypothetical protein